MRVDRRGVLAGLGGAFALTLAGCGRDFVAGGTGNDLRLMVPQQPGGGYDTAARTAAVILEESSLASGIDVFNLPGAGGTVALKRLLDAPGDADFLMLAGMGVVGSVHALDAPVDLARATPIARLTVEPEFVMVPSDGRFADWDEVLAAWTANPASVVAGGGSSFGGPDHLLPLQLAAGLGLAPRSVNYESFQGGGELLPALLDGSVDVGFAGVSEYPDLIDSGSLKVLAVTSAEPLPGLDAPTLRELGLNLVFTNWRGVLAPPDLSVNETRRLVELFADLVAEPAWQQALRDRYTIDAFLPADAFAGFLETEEARITGLLAGLGIS